jgi:hypothetical protein
MLHILERKVPLKIAERKPFRPLGTAVRRLSVSTEVADLLDGRTQFGNFPAVEAERMIGIFCAGQYITLSRKKNEVRPDLEKLEGFDEVWSFCLRKPVPGWRLLGRFFQKDHYFFCADGTNTSFLNATTKPPNRSLTIGKSYLRPR